MKNTLRTKILAIAGISASALLVFNVMPSLVGAQPGTTPPTGVVDAMFNSVVVSGDGVSENIKLTGARQLVTDGSLTFKLNNGNGTLFFDNGSGSTTLAINDDGMWDSTSNPLRVIDTQGLSVSDSTAVSRFTVTGNTGDLSSPVGVNPLTINDTQGFAVKNPADSSTLTISAAGALTDSNSSVSVNDDQGLIVGTDAGVSGLTVAANGDIADTSGTVNINDAQGLTLPSGDLTISGAAKGLYVTGVGGGIATPNINVDSTIFDGSSGVDGNTILNVASALDINGQLQIDGSGKVSDLSGNIELDDNVAIGSDGGAGDGLIVGPAAGPAFRVSNDGMIDRVGVSPLFINDLNGVNFAGGLFVAGNGDISDSNSDITLGERTEISAVTDASGTTGTGGLEIGNTLRIDGNEVITDTGTSLYFQNDNGGNLYVDAGTVFVDSSTNRVGIGDTSPASALQVNGQIRATSMGRFYVASSNVATHNGAWAGCDSLTDGVDACVLRADCSAGDIAISPYIGWLVNAGPDTHIEFIYTSTASGTIYLYDGGGPTPDNFRVDVKCFSPDG